MTDRISIAIIGGGALGMAIACTLLERGRRDIVLLEKNDHFGLEQSGSNSGVIHAGFFYETGTAMAKLCVEGVPLLYKFCRDHSAPHVPVMFPSADVFIAGGVTRLVMGATIF